MTSARTIVETAQVEADHDAAEVLYPRFPELWDAWTWRIARGPDSGWAVPGFHNFHMVKSHGAFAQYGVPETTFLYEIVNADTVRITGLLIAP
jgi:hypothetical protein